MSVDSQRRQAIRPLFHGERPEAELAIGRRNRQDRSKGRRVEDAPAPVLGEERRQLLAEFVESRRGEDDEEQLVRLPWTSTHVCRPTQTGSKRDVSTFVSRASLTMSSTLHTPCRLSAYSAWSTSGTKWSRRGHQGPAASVETAAERGPTTTAGGGWSATSAGAPGSTTSVHPDSVPASALYGARFRIVPTINQVLKVMTASAHPTLIAVLYRLTVGVYRLKTLFVGRSNRFYARPANSSVSVCTFTLSPSLTNSGTRIWRPVSSVAILVTPPLAVSPRTPGSEEVTVSSTCGGN